LFLQKKRTKEKEARNANFNKIGRPLHIPFALPILLKFAPFRGLPSRLDLFNIRFISDILCLNWLLSFYPPDWTNVLI